MCRLKVTPLRVNPFLAIFNKSETPDTAGRQENIFSDLVAYPASTKEGKRDRETDIDSHFATTQTVQLARTGGLIAAGAVVYATRKPKWTRKARQKAATAATKTNPRGTNLVYQ